MVAIDSHALAYSLSNLNSRDNIKLVSHMSNLVTDSSQCLMHLADLVCNVDFPLPDGMIYKMSSISTKIVFTAEPPEGKDATAMSEAAVSGVLSGRAGLKSFRGGATNVLKAVGRHPGPQRLIVLMSLPLNQLFPRQSAGQRDSMIEEILSSIYKVAEMKKTQTHIRSVP